METALLLPGRGLINVRTETMATIIITICIELIVIVLDVKPVKSRSLLGKASIGDSTCEAIQGKGKTEDMDRRFSEKAKFELAEFENLVCNYAICEENANFIDIYDSGNLGHFEDQIYNLENTRFYWTLNTFRTTKERNIILEISLTFVRNEARNSALLIFYTYGSCTEIDDKHLPNVLITLIQEMILWVWTTPEYKEPLATMTMLLRKLLEMCKHMLTTHLSLEDPERPLIAPNLWLLDKFGLILPKNKLRKAAYILLPTIVGFFVLTEYTELYLMRSDLDQVLTNLRISMLSAVCVAKAFSFVVWQKEWLQIFDYVTKADKFERDTRDEVKGKILDQYTKYCRRVTYLYWGVVFTTFLGTIGNPLLRYLSSGTYREELRNGTELFPHIFSSWMPFDKYSSPGCWITVVWHMVLCAWGGAIMAAYDSNIMVMLVFFGAKLDLMQERCRQMFGTNGQGISRYEAEKAIREMHLMHITHMKHIKLQNSLLSPVMFVYVVMCSLMLCASTYQLTTATNIVQMLPLAEYLIFGIAQLFNFCWHCNDVLLKNQRLTQGLFESQWWAANHGQRKSLLLLMGQLNLSHIFTAGPFTNLTLPTFLTILKGAYSYYTLLRK